MATQLCQILAVEKGVKARAQTDLTLAYQHMQKAPQLSGISRTYQPRDDDGEPLPPESTRVQLRASEAIKTVEAALSRLFDVVLTKDVANGVARADIVVGDQTLAEKVPVTFLLFLEKQLVDLATFVSKLPVLDPAETWTYDQTSDAYRTPETRTTRSKKVPRNHVKAEATREHPAQVEMYFEDVLVGDWSTTKFSGALPQARVTELRERVAALADAVKTAREAANSTAVTDQSIGEQIFGYLFAA